MVFPNTGCPSIDTLLNSSGEASSDELNVHAVLTVYVASYGVSYISSALIQHAYNIYVAIYSYACKPLNMPNKQN